MQCHSCLRELGEMTKRVSTQGYEFCDYVCLDEWRAIEYAVDVRVRAGASWS